MVNKGKVLFVYSDLLSFVEKDLNILKENFDVTVLQYRGKKDLFRLLRGVRNTDVNLSWFALGYATTATFFSRIFRKRSLVIIGGWDVVSMPEIGYGAMKTRNRVRKTSYTLKHATKIMAVSESTKKWTQKWVKRKDIITLYHGFDAEKFAPKGEKEDMVLTVGKLTNETTIRVKGLKTFKKAAELLPDVKFVLIGNHDPKVSEMWRAKAPPNLDIIGRIPTEKLIEYYQKAKVYAQLSYQESFGCALAESMLCECMPVVTRRGAIPEVVGNIGFYVEYGDEKSTAKIMKQALISNKGGEARKRVMTLFPLEKRKEELIKTVSDCIK